MKNTIFIILIFLFIRNASAQSARDRNILTYITGFGYSALNDSANLPKTIKPYLKKIMDTLVVKKMNKDSCYYSYSVSTDPHTILFTVTDYEYWVESFDQNEARVGVVERGVTDTTSIDQTVFTSRNYTLPPRKGLGTIIYMQIDKSTGKIYKSTVEH